MVWQTGSLDKPSHPVIQASALAAKETNMGSRLAGKYNFKIVAKLVVKSCPI
jgi:hypothetical protein